MLPSRWVRRCRHSSQSTQLHTNPLQIKETNLQMTFLSEDELDKADAWADKDLTEYWSYPEIGEDREDDAEES